MKIKRKCLKTILAVLTLAFLLQGVSVHAQEPAVDQEPQFPEGELLSVTEVTVGEDSQVTVTQPEQQVPEESEGALSHDQLVSRAALQGVTGQVDGVNGSVIRGWAWDSSRPNTALEVHIYIKNSSGTTVNAISGVMANKYRADLKNAGYGNGYHGYEYAYNFYAHPLGKYTVTVYAISGTGNNPTIGSKTFTHEAWGMLEEVSSTRIKGWAWLSAKPNEAAQVHIYVKNSAGTTVNAIPNVAADIYRSDLPGNGKHGFSRNYEWAAHAPGTYTVEAYVISGKGNNPALGLSPKTYSNGSYTRGALETVTANGMTGWAFKSSALNTSIPVDLRIWKPDGTFDVKHTVADIYRNDMSRFGNGKHGFSYKMDWSGYPDGVYTVVAYAIDGGSNPEIGRKTYVKAGAYIWPTVSKSTSRGYSASVGHWGVDILPVTSNQPGDKIFAFTDGKVTRSEQSSSYGNVVYANHVDPKASSQYLQTRYAHMQDNIPVQKNQNVTKSQVIGYMGHSGQVSSSTGGNGTHLHFETVKVSSLTDIGPVARNTSNSYDPLQRYFTSTGAPRSAAGISLASGNPSPAFEDEEGNLWVGEDPRLYVDYTVDPNPEDFGCCGDMD